MMNKINISLIDSVHYYEDLGNSFTILIILLYS